MVELPAGAAEVAGQVGRILSTRPAARERAGALLEPLRRLAPFEGFLLAVLDPDRRQFLPLTDTGYDQDTVNYYRSPLFHTDAALAGVDHDGPPKRNCDLPFPIQELRVWTELLEPAGFREGVAVPLTTTDGRYVGLAVLHTRSAEHPTEAVRDFLGIIAPMIANSVDPLRSVGVLARMVAGAWAGVVVTRAGTVLPLPGLPGDPLLRPGSGVLESAAALSADDRPHVSFLHHDGERHVRVTVLACPTEPSHLLGVLVLLSPAGDLRGLTRRELMILGLLVEGWSNHRIAADLVVAERTVATHIEHILAKLRVPSRTLAAVRAVRLGLFVPRAVGAAAR